MKPSDLSDELRKFALSREKGEPTSYVPVPKEIVRLRNLEKKHRESLKMKDAQQAESSPLSPDGEQGAERLIGPQSSDHPAVNTDKGGRGVG